MIKKTRKKERKQELDQESDQEEKKISFFLDHFLGRVLVFFLFSYFLVFFYKYPPQYLIITKTNLVKARQIQRGSNLGVPSNMQMARTPNKNSHTTQK